MLTTLYWDANGKTFANGGGGSGNWDTTSLCWSTKAAGGGTLAAWTNGDNATFGGTAGTVTVAASVNAGTITFNTTGYALQGSTLSLPSGTTTIDVASGLTATISATITGSGGLKANGSGELVLSGSNSYTGTTTVSNGTLQLGSSSAIGSGALAVTAGTKALTLTGANAFSGGTVIDNGSTMILANPSGAALQGNIQIGNGTSSGWAYLEMGAADQFGATSVITLIS